MSDDRSAVPAPTGLGLGELVREAATCAFHCCSLLVARRLHLRSTHVGSRVSIPDGRQYVVFRESTCDTETVDAGVVLSVWFRLRAIPPGARLRRRLFERVCVLNTLLFAGFDGFLVKLWMVDPATSDYAGLYSWESAEKAERYGRYITTILRPLSCRGSVGYSVAPDWMLDDYLQAPRILPG